MMIARVQGGLDEDAIRRIVGDTIRDELRELRTGSHKSPDTGQLRPKANASWFAATRRSV